jgi:hypothetical protein
LSGKLTSDEKASLECFFLAEDEVQLNDEIEISIRGGGKPLCVPVTAVAITPDVYIRETDIDFGGIKVGNTATETFTLINNSNIDAHLFLDLRDYPELEVCLPQNAPNPELLENHLIESGSPFFKEDDDLDTAPMQHPLDEEEDDHTSSEDDERTGVYEIQVPKQEELQLQMKFKPLTTEPFMISLPMTLKGINRGTPGITKTV